MSIGASLGHCEKTGKDLASHSRRPQMRTLNSWCGRTRRTGSPTCPQGLNVYPCDSCNGWHVGHQESIPLVWHYTIGKKLTPISSSGELRPRRPQKLTAKQQRSMSRRRAQTGAEQMGRTGATPLVFASLGLGAKRHQVRSVKTISAMRPRLAAAGMRSTARG